MSVKDHYKGLARVLNTRKQIYDTLLLWVTQEIKKRVILLFRGASFLKEILRTILILKDNLQYCFRFTIELLREYLCVKYVVPSQNTAAY